MSSLVGTRTATQENSSSLSLSKPTGVVSGHVLLVQIASNDQTITSPSGWTKYQTSVTGVFEVQQFVKVAGGSEASSYSFTMPSAGPMVGVLTAWEGVNQSTPLGANNHPTQTATTHSEPYTTPTLSGDADQTGRVLYMRATRRVGSTPCSFTKTASGVTELADVGVFSGGSVSYSIGLYAADADFISAGTHNGLAITASPSDEANNVVSTIALTGTAMSPAPNVADSIYQRNAHDGAATLLTGQTLTVIADGEVGDPVLGGGFQVHQQFDFQTDPVDVGKYEVIYSQPYEEAPFGRQGWISRIRATEDMTDVGLACYAILMRRNPILPE